MTDTLGTVKRNAIKSILEAVDRASRSLWITLVTQRVGDKSGSDQLRLTPKENSLVTCHATSSEVCLN